MNPDFNDILSAFSEEGVEYLLVGAYALAVHGLPRATGDIDLWIRPSSENAGRAWKALARFGAPLSDLTQKDLEEKGVVFQIGVPPRRIDILTSIEAVEFEDAWQDRAEVDLEGVRVTAIGRLHLIQNKRALDRPQDRADIARLEESNG